MADGNLVRVVPLREDVQIGGSPNVVNDNALQYL